MAYLYLENKSQKQHILSIKINLKTYKCSEINEISNYLQVPGIKKIYL